MPELRARMRLSADVGEYRSALQAARGTTTSVRSSITADMRQASGAMGRTGAAARGLGRDVAGVRTGGVRDRILRDMRAVREGIDRTSRSVRGLRQRLRDLGTAGGLGGLRSGLGRAAAVTGVGLGAGSILRSGIAMEARIEALAIQAGMSRGQGIALRERAYDVATRDDIRVPVNDLIGALEAVTGRLGREGLEQVARPDTMEMLARGIGASGLQGGAFGETVVALLDQGGLTGDALEEAIGILYGQGKEGSFQLAEMGSFLPRMMAGMQVAIDGSSDSIRHVGAIAQVLMAGVGNSPERASERSDQIYRALYGTARVIESLADAGISIRTDGGGVRLPADIMLDIGRELERQAAETGRLPTEIAEDLLPGAEIGARQALGALADQQQRQRLRDFLAVDPGNIDVDSARKAETTARRIQDTQDTISGAGARVADRLPAGLTWAGENVGGIGLALGGAWAARTGWRYMRRDRGAPGGGGPGGGIPGAGGVVNTMHVRTLIVGSQAGGGGRGRRRGDRRRRGGGRQTVPVPASRPAAARPAGVPQAGARAGIRGGLPAMRRLPYVGLALGGYGVVQALRAEDKRDAAAIGASLAGGAAGAAAGAAIGSVVPVIGTMIGGVVGGVLGGAGADALARHGIEQYDAGLGGEGDEDRASRSALRARRRREFLAGGLTREQLTVRDRQQPAVVNNTDSRTDSRTVSITVNLPPEEVAGLNEQGLAERIAEEVRRELDRQEQDLENRLGNLHADPPPGWEFPDL